MAFASEAANNSVCWLLTAGGLAATGGKTERRAAFDGVVSVALASALVNGALKPLTRRTRPLLPSHRHGAVRAVRTSSFPSGHAASASAFALGAALTQPRLTAPLAVAAAVVSYSRVHNGVHYPGDVVVGAGVGVACALVVHGLELHHPASAAMRRWSSRSSASS